MSTPLRSLLVVEDDTGLQSQLRWSLEEYNVLIAGDRASALAAVDTQHPAVVLQDLGLPPDPTGTSEGFAALAEILQRAPYTKVIVVTGNGDRDNAVKSIGQGAFDFCSKPLDLEVLRLIVSRAFRVSELEAENRALRSQSGEAIEGIVTRSDSMRKVCRLVEKVADSEASVLLLGETGTGKELLARALHRLSARREGPFIAINCAAIPETLLEAELFGYEKGAYTGAAKQTRGKVELAHRGTLLLDEIGDMPLVLQSKLLRFLQDRVIERVGGRSPIRVDLRIVCATHQDLKARIQGGDFREDLFYRISELTIRIPPLRERLGDAVLLARHFLEQANPRHGRTSGGFTPEALRAIAACPWRGNVRELENAVNGAVIMAEGKQISAEDLQLAEGPTERPATLREVREAAELRALRQALALAGDNLSHAAELLGITRPTLYSLLGKYGIDRSGEKIAPDTPVSQQAS